MENTIHIRFRVSKLETPEVFEYIKQKMNEIEKIEEQNNIKVNKSDVVRKYFVAGVEAEISEQVAA